MFTSYAGEIQSKDGPGRAYKVYAEAGSNDGQRPTAVLLDEIHVWVGERYEQVHLILTNGLSKRTGHTLEFNTTTPGFNGDTMAGRMHDYGLTVNSGEIHDPELLFVWWGCPADRHDLNTEDGLQRAIRDANPAADLFVSVPHVAAKFHTIPRNEFYRYYLGLWTVSAKSWLPEGAWNACAEPGKTVPDGAQVVLGFDGSSTRDCTALVAVTCEEIPHVEVIECWERPSDAVHEWKVPIGKVENEIRKCCERFDVAEIACDTYRWTRSFEILQEEGLPVVDFPQTAPHMEPATGRVFDMILGKKLSHSGDLRLARHITNTVGKITSRGMRISKEGPNSPRKIDLVAALVMAADGLRCNPSRTARAVADHRHGHGTRDLRHRLHGRGV